MKTCAVWFIAASGTLLCAGLAVPEVCRAYQVGYAVCWPPAENLQPEICVLFLGGGSGGNFCLFFFFIY